MEEAETCVSQAPCNTAVRPLPSVHASRVTREVSVFPDDRCLHGGNSKPTPLFCWLPGCNQQFCTDSLPRCCKQPAPSPPLTLSLLTRNSSRDPSVQPTETLSSFFFSPGDINFSCTPGSIHPITKPRSRQMDLVGRTSDKLCWRSPRQMALVR